MLRLDETFHNPVKKLLKEKKKILGAWLQMASPYAAEILDVYKRQRLKRVIPLHQPQCAVLNRLHKKGVSRFMKRPAPMPSTESFCFRQKLASN